MHHVPVKNIDMMMRNREMQINSLLWRDHAQHVNFVCKPLDAQAELKVLGKTCQLPCVLVVRNPSIVSHGVPDQ